MIQQGELVILTSGHYSDYSIILPTRARNQFDWREVTAEYLALWPEDKEHYKFNDDRFVAWLLNEKQLLEPVDWIEWNYASYSRVDEAYIRRNNADWDLMRQR